mmetsp:Transcript_17078/g.28445  ORF Transcript_17078/g.28445 Transcript_17078/m.28445 type:complete len:265 (+) Transcript_17078:54-848(+)
MSSTCKPLCCILSRSLSHPRTSFVASKHLYDKISVDCSTATYPRLVRGIHHKQSISVELLADKLIRHECDGLSGHDTEEARGNALPQCRRSLFLSDHHAGLEQTTVLGLHALSNDLLLHPCFDNVKGIVHHGAESTTDTSKDQALPRPQTDVALALVLPPLNDCFLEVVVSSEINSLVASLTHHGRYYTLVQRPDTFLPNNHGCRLQHVGVLAVLQLGRIDHGIVLTLHPNFAHLGRRYHHNSLGQARGQSGKEGDGSSVLSRR